MFLTDLWYVAALSSELKPGRMLRRELFGEPVLIGRTRGGEAFALRDICPHRAAPLSAGQLVEDGGGAEVECPYHGWRFGAGDGVCRAIPSLASKSDANASAINVRRYPSREQHGVVWLFVAADRGHRGEPASQPPDFPAAAISAPRVVLRQRFACHMDHAVLGLMDPAHGPYVHKQWWWRTKPAQHVKEKRFEPRELGFSMAAHAPSSNSRFYKLLGSKLETEIIFRLPGVRVETVRAGKRTVFSFTAVTPVDERATEVTQILYWDVPLFTVLTPFIRQMADKFLGQDRAMVELQQQGLKYDPNLMLLDDADAQARWYHALKKEWTEAGKGDRSFKNPVEATTLRWRS